MTTTYGVELETLHCGHCGIVFAVPEYWVWDRRQDHKIWYCPTGHPRHFPAKSDLEEAREQAQYYRTNYEHQREIRETVERQLSATKGVVTRIKNRVAKGVCPCCKRTFADLAAHMENKHPTWAREER